MGLCWARRALPVARAAGAAPRVGRCGLSTEATEESPVLAMTEGRVGVLALNRPKKLHTLTEGIIEGVQGSLQTWRDDPAVQCVVMRSEPWGGKAFCAGGDVRLVYESGLDASTRPGFGHRGSPSADFFRLEYEMNYVLSSFPKPQVSYWDGIVMGGGCGISSHGRFRVATERAMFAMPETAIGLFPDVGMTYALPRLDVAGLDRAPHQPSAVGVYLGLTGARLKVDDLMFTGLATHAVASNDLQRLHKALVAAPDLDENTVEAMLNEFQCSGALKDAGTSQDSSIVLRNLDGIARCFGDHRSVEDIVAALDAEVSAGGSTAEWADKTRGMLALMSPTSMKLTLQMLWDHATLPMDEVLVREYRASQRCMRQKSDFYEGIRAVLVDRGDPPARWAPATLQEVQPSDIAEFVAPLEPENELDLSPTP